MRHGRTLQSGRGMTLIEVLAALAILVVLSAAVIGFFISVNDRRDQLVRLAAQQRGMAVLFDRLESSLLSGVALAPDGTPGVRGDGASITVVTRGVTGAIIGDPALADAEALTFAFDEASHTCVCTLKVEGAEAIREVVADGVERMRFRYSDGRSWSTDYDAVAASGLPSAVEISVWLEPRTGRRDTQVEAPGSPAEPADEGSGLSEPDLGPMDLPPPPPDEAWTPREPDHIRVIVVPDAPTWRERGA